MAQLQGARAVWNREGGYFNIGRVAVIPIIGTLVQRSSWLGALSGLMSYVEIEHSFTEAMADPAADEIIFEIDSPGGEVAGAFDLADRIFAARGEKPMTAIAAEFSASAAYLLASAADQVVLPRTAMVGSIGVVAAHMDISKAMAKTGRVVTFVYAGEKKIDGNQFQPLPERVRAEWQADINALYNLFVSAVARNRGINENLIRETEAGMFMGERAIEAGLADRVNTFSDEVHNASLGQANEFRLTATKEGKTMSDKDKAAQEQQIAEARTEGVAEGRKAAIEENEKAVEAAKAAASTAERERIKSIVTHEHAEGRETFVAHLAFETDTDVDEAGKMLEAAPKGSGESALERAMREHGTPAISSAELPAGDAPKLNLDPTAIYRRLNSPYKADEQGQQ
jgi:signal peptide peptidase SppA